MLAGVAVLTAPLAHAAPVADFLRKMAADGIESSQSPDDLVVVARGACEMLNSENGKDVSNYVYEQTGLSEAHSLVFVADAVHYFCPWQDHSGGQVWTTTHPGGQALS
jgi:hypothetical protein